jgi:hypothetical protein
MRDMRDGEQASSLFFERELSDRLHSFSAVYPFAECGPEVAVQNEARSGDPAPECDR